MRVLIADDNQINRAFVKGVLGGQGHDLQEASDGREAVTCFREKPCDLIFMDLRMPEMDGVEAATAIRQLAAGHQPVIVALTADLQLQQETDLLQQGFDGCLSKPVSGQTLLALVRQHTSAKKPDEASATTALIDTEAALAAAGGNRELLDRLLAMLGTELRRFVPQIRAHVSAGQRSEARELTHKLRGSAGYTGAVALQAATAELELALTRDSQTEIELAMDHLTAAADDLLPLLTG